jgi:hypothetical protein
MASTLIIFEILNFGGYIQRNFFDCASFRCLDILVIEQPFSEIGLDHALILKVSIMTMGSSAPTDSMYRIMLMLNLVYNLKLMHSFKV